MSDDIQQMDINIVWSLEDDLPDIGSVHPDDFPLHSIKRTMTVSINGGEQVEVPFPNIPPYPTEAELVEYCKSYMRDQYIKHL
jgi:hypothetical protein